MNLRRALRLQRRPVNMRPAARALLLTAMLLTMSSTAWAQPPTDGTTTIVSDDTTWSDDTTMNGHVVVENGAILTVEGDVNMVTGSSITVNEGGELNLQGGSLTGESLDAGRMVNSVPTTSVTVNFGDLADTGVVQLQFDHTIAAGVDFNVSLGDETQNLSGLDTVQFNAPLNGTNLTFTFTSYYFTPTYLSWAQAIHSGGSTVRHQAMDTASDNAPLYWFNAAFDILVNGQLNAEASNITGANITCQHHCRFNGANLVGSAPIHVANTTSIEMVGSTVAGSRTDEDIVLHDEATIVYSNNVGTGGTTDAWIRLLSERVIQTNIPGGSLDITGIGWSASQWNDLTDDQGRIVLVAGEATNEHKRIVEWMDGEGNHATETANITLSITSNWGVFSTTVPAPATAFGTINLDLPFVSITALEPEDITATVNRSLGFMMTVENTGNADVTANLRCYVDGSDADTAPSTITVTVEAGSSADIPVTWYAYEAGDLELTCRPFLPDALSALSDDVADLDGMTMAPVNWQYADEVEDAPILIWATAVVVFGAIALGVARASKGRLEAKEFGTDVTEATTEALEPTEDAASDA